ncbi:MAG: cell envelope integrity EipB family protein [Parvibaculum sp.]|uniref:cell envelope integrity EipB family protein n=1 Tax=Parvibaculum sp. TaxID=2024848 RepID=UPI002724909C|nr:cell envelope integrity EipB family protein [Parvibaculum sp.]MDO8840075.1 cell envelope integrity EipB family protein [Parvibaculum sp.]
MRTTSSSFVAVLLWTVAMHSTAAAVEAELQMHRAVYELSLGRSQAVSDVAGIEGRMVVEWRGGRECGGYTSMQRVVTQVTGDEDRAVSNDVRLSTWEAADGGEFRFTRTEYVNGQLVETESGIARRAAPKGAVTVEREGLPPIEIPGEVLFPVAYNLQLMAAAKAGRQLFSAPIFDGTEEGENPTNAFIGKTLAIPDDALSAAVSGSVAPLLSEMTARPVRLSYFDRDAREGLPNFEMGYVLLSNGVSASLVLDYDDVVMNGRLSEVHYFAAGSC